MGDDSRWPTQLFSTTKAFVGRVREKLKVVREKGYTTCDQEVKSLTQLFPIAKTWKQKNGENIVDEVRMVYDATKSTLNEIAFDPCYSMSIIDTILRSITAGSYMTDCDGGGDFCEPGVDLTQVFPKDTERNGWKRKGCWSRILMGFAPFPYFVTKEILIVE